MTTSCRSRCSARFRRSPCRNAARFFLTFIFRTRHCCTLRWRIFPMSRRTRYGSPSTWLCWARFRFCSGGDWNSWGRFLCIFGCWPAPVSIQFLSHSFRARTPSCCCFYTAWLGGVWRADPSGLGKLPGAGLVQVSSRGPIYPDVVARREIDRRLSVSGDRPRLHKPGHYWMVGLVRYPRYLWGTEHDLKYGFNNLPGLIANLRGLISGIVPGDHPRFRPS